MWCLRCYEPVRQLTPREPQLPALPSVTVPRVERPRSRWKAGGTTFGPVGRIAITVLVLLFAPTSFDLVALVTFWPCYLALAFVVLRSTWSSDYVDLPGAGDHAGADAPDAGPERFPAVREPIPRSTIVAWSLLIVLGIGVAVVFFTSGHVGQGLIGIGASLVALVMVLRWAISP
jgi:hypothetical protein